MQTLRQFAEDLARADTVHWLDADCAVRGAGTTSLSPGEVTCPVCRLIMAAALGRSQAIAARREEDRHYHEELRAVRGDREKKQELQAKRRASDRAWQAGLREERRRVGVEFWEKVRARSPVQIIREKPKPAIPPPPPADVRGYARRETIQSRDRATRLSDLQEALDGWPDVHIDQAYEAIDELRLDRRQDPDHYVDLRRYHWRGELRW